MARLRLSSVRFAINSREPSMKPSLKRALSVLLGLLLAGCMTSQAPVATGEPPELLLYNGKVVTVDGRFSIAQAVAIRGGKFVAVGSNDEVRRLARASTRSIDLRGRTVVPGLMDGHLH